MSQATTVSAVGASSARGEWGDVCCAGLLLALSFLLLGVNRLSPELHLGVMNALTILCTYLLVKRTVDERAGLICALMVSVCPWFVIKNIHLEFYFVLVAALYFFSKGSNLTYLMGGILLRAPMYELDG